MAANAGSVVAINNGGLKRSDSNNLLFLVYPVTGDANAARLSKTSMRFICSLFVLGGLRPVHDGFPPQLAASLRYSRVGLLASQKMSTTVPCSIGLQAHLIEICLLDGAYAHMGVSHQCR